MTASAASVIWLTGFMAAGKSTVGAKLAARLGRPFYDTDHLIEQAAGVPVAELFARDGEAVFREKEREAVRTAASFAGAVVALGGGALLNPDNAALIQETGPLLCLTATPTTVLDRLSDDERAARPLLAGPDPAAAVARLLSERESVYAVADAHIATDGQSPDEVVAACLHVLEERTWL